MARERADLDWMDVETKAWVYKIAHKELWASHYAKSRARKLAERLLFWGFIYMSVNIYIQWSDNHYRHFIQIVLNWFSIRF